MSYSTAAILLGTGGSDNSSKLITQANSFSVGNVVYFDGSVYRLAIANAANTLGLWIIKSCTGSDFTIASAGYMEGFTGLTAGEYHYLSSTVSGGLTATEPGTYSNPLLFAVSASAGWVLPYRPSSSGPVITPAAALQNYSEVTYALPSTGTINLDLANGNVQSCAVGNGSVTFVWPTRAAAGSTKTITLYITQASSAQTISFSNAVGGKEGLDITSGGWSTPSASKRSVVTAKSYNGSEWLYTQVWREG